MARTWATAAVLLAIMAGCGTGMDPADYPDPRTIEPGQGAVTVALTEPAPWSTVDAPTQLVCSFIPSASGSIGERRDETKVAEAIPAPSAPTAVEERTCRQTADGSRPHGS